MKTCPNCQRVYSDSISFCSKCGAALNGSNPAQQQNANQQQNTYQQQNYVPNINQQPNYQQNNYQQNTYQQPNYQQNQYQQQGYQQNGYQQNQYRQPYQQNNYQQRTAAPQVGFVDAIKLFFGNYANFSGRSRRSEYFWIILFNWLVSFVLSLVLGAAPDILMTLTGLYSLATLVPGLALAVRRLHDVGKNGTYLLWCLTIIGAIPVLIAVFKDSDPNPNQFGPSPKYS